jgi:hypothetical protein
MGKLLLGKSNQLLIATEKTKLGEARSGADQKIEGEWCYLYVKFLVVIARNSIKTGTLIDQKTRKDVKATD